MNGFEKELREKVLGFTSHVTVYKNPTSENYDLSEFKNLKNKNKILGYSPYIERESLISSNISSTNAMVRAIEPELERNVGITHKNITSGSYAELEDSQDNIILGNEKELKLEAELTLKGKSEMVPLVINVTRLAEELVQIQSELIFSRTNFEIGIGQWSNISILKDKIIIKTNLFLFKE